MKVLMDLEPQEMAMLITAAEYHRFRGRQRKRRQQNLVSKIRKVFAETFGKSPDQM